MQTRKEIQFDNSNLILIKESFEKKYSNLKKEKEKTNVQVNIEITIAFPKETNQNKEFIKKEGNFNISLKIEMFTAKEKKSVAKYSSFYSIKYKIIGNNKITEKMVRDENLIDDDIMKYVLKRAQSSFNMGGFKKLNFID